MELVGTLLSPLHPFWRLISFFAGDAGDDETDGTTEQTSEKGDTGSGDDGQQNQDDEEEPTDDETDDETLDDDLPQDEVVRRNASRLDSKKDTQLTAAIEANVELLMATPEKAKDMLQKIEERDPALAKRIGKMYANRQNNALGSILTDADPAVRNALQTLADQVTKVSKKTEQQMDAMDKRTYLTWEKSAAPFLNPKSKEGTTPLGKKLREEFVKQLDRLAPSEQPLDEETLSDALTLAKRKAGWNDKNVKTAMNNFAAKLALKNRGTTVPRGGKGLNSEDDKGAADPAIAEMFGSKDPKRLEKIAAAKKEARFK